MIMNGERCCFVRCRCRSHHILGRGNGFMVVYLNDEAAFVESHVPLGKVFQHVVRYCALPEMFEKNAHRRIVAKHALLLVESKVVGMQMNDQRGRIAGILLKYVLFRDHFRKD